MITSSSIEPALPNKSIHQMENESLMFIIIVAAEEYENPKDHRREKWDQPDKNVMLHI